LSNQQVGKAPKAHNNNGGVAAVAAAASSLYSSITRCNKSLFKYAKTEQTTKLSINTNTNTVADVTAERLGHTAIHGFSQSIVHIPMPTLMYLHIKPSPKVSPFIFTHVTFIYATACPLALC